MGDDKNSTSEFLVWGKYSIKSLPPSSKLTKGLKKNLTDSSVITMSVTKVKYECIENEKSSKGSVFSVPVPICNGRVNKRSPGVQFLSIVLWSICAIIGKIQK